ncbi:hypothetical protein RAC89_23005 [Paenibacillus sp. GD4]|uniref:hypothetical protein n=1 Tax=Paenibacillus sp. GD4 TaxID=3068890 RepID=UPI0027967B0F|nr:hypothetical protein [Paenibacillus sp. GD4]MDQ1913270.1 hypothetical protein [Paenibacillus sp. GD4]
MNIGGLFRGMMGDVQASEPKSLELKTGQVVRGVVLQVLPEQEALMNIGGVQVRAKLETPLKQGQSTMLQVQPESANGQVNLKPLESSGGVQIADSSLPDVIKSLAISDTPANRQLVQALHQAGIALTKENVQAFVQLAGQMPASIPLEDWLPAGIVAIQKGVPLTPEAVLSVKQAIQGQPIHETLTRLEDAIERELGGGKPMTPDSRALLEGVKALVQQVRAASAQLLAQAEVETPLGTNAGAGAQSGVAAMAAGASGSAGAGAQASVAATAAGASGSAGAGAQASGAAGASGSAGAGAQASVAATAAGASGAREQERRRA